MEFRTKQLELYRGLGFTDLEKTLEHESKKLYKDEMIENLMKIVNKLEENKKLEKMEERVFIKFHIFFILKNYFFFLYFLKFLHFREKKKT